MTLSKNIKYVMSSAGETEAASAYLNCKMALPLRIALEEIGHPQPKTPVIVDNILIIGLLTSAMTPKRSKVYDIRTNWMKYREIQQQFVSIWKPGTDNRGDYHTKVHPPNVYKNKKDYVLN